MKRVAWFALFLVIGASCLDQPDCFRQDVNLIGISFRKMYDGALDTVLLDTVYTTFSYSATENHTLPLYGKGSVSVIALPLNYLKNNTDFTLIKEDRDYLTTVNSNHELDFTHFSKAQFVSEACGERFVVSQLAINQSTFDSVRLASNKPANPAQVNVYVYRCPRTNLLRFNFRQLYMVLDDANSRGKLDVRPITQITNSGVTWSSATTQSSVILALNPAANSTTYEFAFANGDKDTLTLNYQRKDTTIIDKCGVQQVYTINDVSHTFEILKIQLHPLHDPPHSNVEAYRCPVTNQIRVTFKQTRSGVRISDTLDVSSVTADYLASPIVSASKISSIVLPLNPDTNATTYTFNVNGEATSVLTLTLSYTTGSKEYHTVCQTQTNFAGITIDEAGTSFYDNTSTVIDPVAKFPVTSNIDIVRK